MAFNKHSELEGKHSFLSPSKSSWVNYDLDKLDSVFEASKAAARGTRLHKLAHDLIREKQKLPATKETMCLYVNDAIGFRMTPEQPLRYSKHCFGTADALSFRRNKLRVHDLKTGEKETSERQLEVYVALFCLEYGFLPFNIEMELRIYQSDEVRIYDPDPVDITLIMDRIKVFSARLDELEMEAPF